MGLKGILAVVKIPMALPEETSAFSLQTFNQKLVSLIYNRNIKVFETQLIYHHLRHIFFQAGNFSFKNPNPLKNPYFLSFLSPSLTHQQMKSVIGVHLCYQENNKRYLYLYFKQVGEKCCRNVLFLGMHQLTDLPTKAKSTKKINQPGEKKTY